MPAMESTMAEVEPFFNDIQFQELAQIPEFTEFPEVAMVPPLPEMNFKRFDYKKYEQEGEKYLKRWTKAFRKDFDADYKKRFEEWGKEYEKQAAERTKELEMRALERAEKMEERAEKRAAIIAKRNQDRAHMLERHVKERKNLLRLSDDNKPNVFYFLSEGEHRNFKVKKTLKIKMPKSTRLKMDVKYVEIKLAETTKNIDAHIKYANLVGHQVDGEKYQINASYSPLRVTTWKNGALAAKYSESIYLQHVENIDLNTISSEVTIDSISKEANIENELGRLLIGEITPNSNSVFIKVKNGEVNASLPSMPFSLYLNEKYSKVNYPETLFVKSFKNEDYGLNFNPANFNDEPGPAIIITSTFSEVNVKN